PVGRRTLEVVAGWDVELAIQGRDGLGSDTLEVKQIENGRRKLGDELAMVGRVTGFGDFADARGEILADSRNFPQLGRLERCQLMRVIRGDVGAVAVRANLERIVVLDLEQVGDLPQDPRDREVIQAADLPSRRGSRAGAPRRQPARRQSPNAPGAGRSRKDTRRRPLRTPWRQSL